eukprot:scaffold9941_cov30-Attheya_sp.AAC.1
MASAFKMAGQSKYYNLSLDYVDNMSFHLSLESLHHVRLSMHELLYPGKSDSDSDDNSDDEASSDSDDSDSEDAELGNDDFPQL